MVPFYLSNKRAFDGFITYSYYEFSIIFIGNLVHFLVLIYFVIISKKYFQWLIFFLFYSLWFYLSFFSDMGILRKEVRVMHELPEIESVN